MCAYWAATCQEPVPSPPMTNCCDDLDEVHDRHCDHGNLAQTELRRLSDLFRNTNPTFLMGAGCSYVAEIPTLQELENAIIEDQRVSDTAKIILSVIREGFTTASASKPSHIEDYLSELIDLKAIAERRRRKDSRDVYTTIGGIEYSDIEISEVISDITNSIADAVDIDLCADKLVLHRRFVRAAQKTVRDGRAEHIRQLSYLVLNYDTLLETALALERIRYADGMFGGPIGWWDMQSFSLPGTQALVYKLHGSVDWIESSDDQFSRPRRMPRTLASRLNNGSKAMIWPAETKYRETRQDPFAQLAEEAWKNLRQQRSMPPLLVTCGYSFGDAHVNDEIERCLAEVTELTLVALVSSCCPGQVPELARWSRDDHFGSRVTTFGRRGIFRGQESTRTHADMDWWRFEVLVDTLEQV